MPVRSICRLLVVRTEGGKLKVRYGHIGDDCVRLPIARGPEMLIPPTGEMTEAELDRWEFELVSERRFSLGAENTALAQPNREPSTSV